MRAVWLRSTVKTQNNSKLTNYCETNQCKLTYSQSVLTSQIIVDHFTRLMKGRGSTHSDCFFLLQKATESTEIQEYCETRKDCVIVIETDFALKVRC